MSLKNQYTTADYVEWDEAISLIKRLYKDGKYRMSLLIGCGCFFGLRFSDLRQLRWWQLLTNDVLVLFEKKTGKRREIRINKKFQDHIRKCYTALGIENQGEPCFLTHEGRIICIQTVNKSLKNIKARYSVKVNNFSTHSLRKTFGREVVHMAGKNSEMALIRLSEIFQHSSPMITRRYLGLRKQELGEIYESLRF